MIKTVDDDICEYMRSQDEDEEHLVDSNDESI